MKPEEFLRQARLLTGTDIKSEPEIDTGLLEAILADDSRRIDCSQFNELLLLVHKDRVEQPFFRYFFRAECSVGEIADRVQRFQKVAMLQYGNFAFAYRRLSRIKDGREFRNEVKEVARSSASELKRFENRKQKLLPIDKIDRDVTPYVGYLSASQITAEHDRCELLCRVGYQVGDGADWDKYREEVTSLAGVQEQPVLMEILQNYRERFPTAGPAEFESYLQAPFSDLKRLSEQVNDVRRRAARNQSAYLTWDHMDVYFATSMRKAWEYEDLYDFIGELMSAPELQGLGVRYFDPTQSFADNRVDKGLVEALMLKRARCTVYSVQDTDTLGKDSELASTLAQGKPVIAYVPDLDVEMRTLQLLSEDPATILDRLRFVLYADEHLAQHLTNDQYALLGEVQDELAEFLSARIWLSLPDSARSEVLKARLGQRLREFCRVVASSEKAVYDKRAETLRDKHPLAIQVNLDTGVANGVLVVRTVPDCAALLRRILLHDMEFDLEEKDQMWYLRERISGCVFRVVTNDRKLSNCFWNFYLR